MKRFLIAAAVVASTVANPAFAADVGVSISIGDPNFYGRLDIGGYPPPQVIYRQPIIVERARQRQPVYLRVPPGHAKHWRKHCRKYNACGEQVYFVKDDWYNRDYAPRYRKQRNEHRQDRHDDRGNKSGKHNKHNGNDHNKGRGHN